MYLHRKWLHAGLSFVVIVAVMWVGQVQAQEKYPTRSVNIICGFTTGSADLAARAMLPFLTKKWGVPVNVVNKPGGNGVPAVLEVYTAPPDGYTLFADGQPFSSLLPLIAKDLPFKIMDRSFIAMEAYGPGVVIVPPNSPYETMNDLAAEAKKDPANFTWASQGGIGGSDYQMRRFLKVIGVDVLKTKPVMTQGGAAGAAMVAGNHIKTSFSAFASALPLIQAGTVRPIAVLWKTRDDALPNVPTVGEQGYPTVVALFWTGVSGPPKLPAHVIDVWDRTSREMAKDVEYTTRMKNIGMRPTYVNAKDTRDYVEKDMQEAAEIYGRGK
jgi:tripartite-type tricarboxylate transporter receptor subunit TctC